MDGLYSAKTNRTYSATIVLKDDGTMGKYPGYDMDFEN